MRLRSSFLLFFLVASLLLVPHPSPTGGKPEPLQGVAVFISPSYHRGPPGRTLNYLILVKNEGEVSDSFTLTASDSLGWKLALTENKLENVGPGLGRVITLSVQIPENADPALNEIVVTATSLENLEVENSSSCIAEAEEKFFTPQWVRHAIFYQILPDRFFNAESANDPKGDGSSGDVLWEGFYGPYKQATLFAKKMEWGEPVEYWVEAPWGENVPSLGRDWFGGDLQGIAKKIPYLLELGVNALYLNPIFDSTEAHGYSIIDYKSVNRYFGAPPRRERDPSVGPEALKVIPDREGGLEVFENLMAELETHGMRAVLDVVFKYCSAKNRWFDRDNDYPTLGAFESMESPWFEWFTFEDWPLKYKDWLGFYNLPELRETEGLKDYIYRDPENSVIKFWNELGISGWCLTLGTAMSPQFWEEFRAYFKQLNPEGLIVGRGPVSPDPLSPGWFENKWDSCVNYTFREAIKEWLTGGSAEGLESKLAQVKGSYHSEVFYSLLNPLSDHDTRRMLTELLEDREKMKLAVIFQMTYPGAPVIYYGDEVGMKGELNPLNRQPYPWPELGGKIDQNLLNHYKKLISIRNRYSVLRTGSIQTRLAEGNIYCLVRIDNSDHPIAILVFNNGAEPQSLELEVGDLLPEGARVVDVLNENRAYVVKDGNISVEVDGIWASILIASKFDVEVEVSPQQWNTLERGVLSPIKLKIFNRGLQPDSYSISILDPQNWAKSLSENKIENIAPGENREIFLIVEIPENTSDVLSRIIVEVRSSENPSVKARGLVSIYAATLAKERFVDREFLDGAIWLENLEVGDSVKLELQKFVWRQTGENFQGEFENMEVGPRGVGLGLVEGDHWQLLSNAPEGVRHGGALVWAGGDHIYAFRGGGTAKFWRYSISSDSWEPVAEAPDVVDDGAALLWTGENYIYALQGYSGFWRYSIDTNSWSELKALPEPVKSVGALAWAGENYIFVLKDIPLGGNLSFLRYSISADDWVELAPFPAPLEAGGALVWAGGNDLYALGGGDKPFWRYSIDQSWWWEETSPPQPIGLGVALVYPGLGDHIYALRGNNTQDFWRYSISTRRWEELEPLPAPAHWGASLTFVKPNAVYALVGGGNDEFWRYTTPKYSSTGVFTSRVHDAGGIARWTKISWRSFTPPGTSVEVQTQTSLDNLTWSSWASCENGAPPPSPENRFIRFRIILLTSDPSVTPWVEELKVEYERRAVTGKLIRVIDGRILISWDNLSYQALVPKGTSLAWFTRSSPDGQTWSGWEELGPDNAIQSPSQRYLQVKAVLHGDGKSTPVLKGYEVCSTQVKDRTPPQAPSPLEPRNHLITSLGTPTFSWTRVSDPSGVSYVLQLDLKPRFSDPLVKEIGESSFTLPEKDVLGDGVYYWRVKAVDGWGNESEWSPIWSFEVERAPISSMQDPEGDDQGPGTYTYPTALPQGCLDLTGFSISPRGGMLLFELTFKNLGGNPWGGEQGFSFQLIEIYIDKDGVPGSGETETFPPSPESPPYGSAGGGSNVEISEDFAYEVAMRVGGWENYGNRLVVNGELRVNELEISADEERNTISILAPALIGSPTLASPWYVMVLVGSWDGGWFREVKPGSAETWMGGGADPEAYEFRGGVHPRVYDMLWSTAEGQYDILQGYSATQGLKAKIPGAGPFSLGVDRTPPPVPAKLEPSLKWINDNTPILRWTECPDISGVRYQLQLDNEFPPLSPLIYENDNIQENSLALPLELADGGYWWRVQAVDGVGNESGWSPPSQFWVDTSPPEVPKPIAPVHGAWTSDNTPTFLWTEVWDEAGVVYEIQISARADFGELEFTASGLRENTFTLPDENALPDGKYYWRVRAKDNAGNASAWSPRRAINIRAAKPARPTLLSPAEGSLTREAVLRFKWEEVFDPSGVVYHLQISTSPEFLVREVEAEDLETNLFSAPLAEGVYYWRVRARNGVGTWSEWSEVWRVEVDRTPPPLSILTDLPAEVFAPAWVLEGKTEPGALVRIYVGENLQAQVKAGVDGRFSSRIVLLEGLNVIKVTSTDGAGNTGPEEVQAVVYTKLVEEAIELDLMLPGQSRAFPLVGCEPFLEVVLTAREEVISPALVAEVIEAFEPRPPGVIYGYIRLETNLSPEAIGLVELRFRVEKSWLREKGVRKEAIEVWKLEEVWTKVGPARLLTEDQEFVYYSIKLTELSVFAVVGKGPPFILLLPWIAGLGAGIGMGVWVWKSRRKSGSAEGGLGTNVARALGNPGPEEAKA